MKTTLFIMVLLLFGGCASTQKSSYRIATIPEVAAKARRNAESRDYVYQEWRYAGSDEAYDYIYEYDPGSAFPAHNFRFYKLVRDELDVHGPRYPFDPSLGNNRSLTY